MEPQGCDETMKDCCKVCFNLYNDTQRRPRVLPCGHSYCNLCISNHLVENKIVCPTCRREHCADNTTQFPINYELEQNLSTNTCTPDANSKTTTFPSVKPQGISKMLASSRDEYCKTMETAEAEVRGKKSNLQGYESQMNAWKEEHQKEMEVHLLCAQEHREMITCINKENQIVKDVSGQADNILKEVRTSANNLNAANTDSELLLSMGKSSTIYESAREWNSDVQEAYPNSELIIRSQKLREKSRLLLGKWKALPVNDQLHQDTEAASADEISACGERRDMKVEFTNIQEKMKALLANLESLQKDQMTQTIQTEETPSLNISDPKALIHPVRILIESNRVFTIKQSERGNLFARISTDKRRDICVHTLRKDVEVPTNAILLQHGDLVGVDVRPGLTFLDLAAEGQPLGRLRIRLDPERGNYPLNFNLLCTGEEGASYAHSGVFEVYGRGRDSEIVALGDYERNEGMGGRGVVPGVDWREEGMKMIEIYGGKKWEAGSVGVRWQGEEAASQFVVYTKDRKNQTLNNVFGKLDDEESLNVLKEALGRYCHKKADGFYTDDNLKKIVIADCGVILPRH